MDRGTVRRIMVGRLLRMSMTFSSGVGLDIEVMGKSGLLGFFFFSFLITNCGRPRRKQ